MVKSRSKDTRAWRLGLLLIIVSVFINSTYALDNPDAPDQFRDFELQAQVYLKAADNPKNDTRDYLIAYDDDLRFLDEQLDIAYCLLISKLPVERRQVLKTAQHNWTKFRDAEFKLIKNNWTRRSFGTSAAFSRGTTVAALSEIEYYS